MSVSAIGGVSSGAISAGSGASQAKPAAAGIKQGSAGSSPANAGVSPQAGGEGLTRASNTNMSTGDFISLTQKVGQTNESPALEMPDLLKDAKDMTKMIIALYLLDKIMEMTSKLIEGLTQAGGTGGGTPGNM